MFARSLFARPLFSLLTFSCLLGFVAASGIDVAPAGGTTLKSPDGLWMVNLAEGWKSTVVQKKDYSVTAVLSPDTPDDRAGHGADSKSSNQIVCEIELKPRPTTAGDSQSQRNVSTAGQNSANQKNLAEETDENIRAVTFAEMREVKGVAVIAWMSPRGERRFKAEGEFSLPGKDAIFRCDASGDAAVAPKDQPLLTALAVLTRSFAPQ